MSSSKKILVVIFGCLSRSLSITHKNHKNKIFDKLTKLGFEYDAHYVNNETEEIDGVKTTNSYKGLIPLGKRTDIQQHDIDNQIKSIHPNYDKYFRRGYFGRNGVNPGRNSYIETKASKLLASSKFSEFENALVFCSDFWLEKEFDESWINGESITIGDQNPGQGFTNGFYCGDRLKISKLLDSFHNLENLAKKDFEYIIKKNSEIHNISIIQKDIKFLKIRADGEPAYKHTNGRIWDRIKHIEPDFIKSGGANKS